MIIFRYLVREIVYVMLAVLIIFVLVFLSTQLAIYLQKMAQGQLAASVLMQLTATFIPLLTGLLAPMAFFIAIMLAYGRLYAESEMTVLHACGYGRGHLLKDTVILSFFVVLVVAWLVMLVTPNVMRYQRELLAQTVTNNFLQTLVPGQFKSQGNRVFYVEKASRDHKTLGGIFTATQGGESQNLMEPTKKAQPADTTQTWDVVFAGQAEQHYFPERHGAFVVAKNGYRYVGEAGKYNFRMTHYGSYAVRVPTPELAGGGDNNVNTQSMAKLWANYHEPASAAEFQWRISIPLQTFILCLLAVPLSRTRPRQGRYAPLLPAVLIYTVYGSVLYAARDWVSHGVFSIGVGMWWIHGLLLLLAIYLFLGKPGWQGLVNLLLFRRKQ